MCQLTRRDSGFFPTCHILIRQAAPERVAWPTAPLMGAMQRMLLPQSLTPITVVTQTQEGEERDGGEATTTARPQRRAARQQRALLDRLIQDDLL